MFGYPTLLFKYAVDLARKHMTNPCALAVRLRKVLCSALVYLRESACNYSLSG